MSTSVKFNYIIWHLHPQNEFRGIQVNGGFFSLPFIEIKFAYKYRPLSYVTFTQWYSNYQNQGIEHLPYSILWFRSCVWSNASFLLIPGNHLPAFCPYCFAFCIFGEVLCEWDCTVHTFDFWLHLAWCFWD